MSLTASRSRVPGVVAGITDAMIIELVHTFYQKVRTDKILGPIFNAEVRDWPAHLEKLSAFWSSVTLMTGQYKGKPIPAHARLPQIDARHFDRWLQLFAETAWQICPSKAAALFVDRSERIAASLKLGLAFHRGESILPQLWHPNT